MFFNKNNINLNFKIMSRLLTGSIDLSKLREILKAKHPAVYVSPKTGVQYLNISVWVNDEPNQYDQVASISVYDKETKQSVYLSNLKEFQTPTGQGPADQNADASDYDMDDLPF